MELGAGGSDGVAGDPAELVPAGDPVDAGPKARDADGRERDSIGLCGGIGASCLCFPPNLLGPTEP